MSWLNVKLGELINVKHGFAFDGKYFTNSGNFVLLSPGNCHESGGLKLKGDKEKFYSGDFPKDFILEENDLLIVMTDLMQSAPILGGAFMIPESNRFLHNQRLGLVRIKNVSSISKRFLYYALNSDSYRAQVRGSASGATVKHTAPERIYKCLIPFPPLETQQRIADILSSYDDLIEVNRRRIKLLEDSARLLYQEWFVRLRFPEHERVPLVDGVPDGWELFSAADILHINPTEKAPKNREIRYVSMSCLSQNGMTIDSKSVENRVQATSVRFRNDDTLLARITPCLENGKTAFVQFLNYDEIACGSSEFIIMRGKRVGSRFTYCLSRSDKFRDHAIQSMIGSSGRQRVPNTCFKEFYLVLPPQNLLFMFEEITKPNFNQIQILLAQNQKLQQARDLLLPRLMRGELLS